MWGEAGPWYRPRRGVSWGIRIKILISDTLVHIAINFHKDFLEKSYSFFLSFFF